MKTFRGYQPEGSKAQVTVHDSDNSNSYPLKHLVKHTPVGFGWGDGGAGAADLAWSLLIDIYGKDAVHFVEFIYQKFKKEVIATLPKTEWSLTSTAVEENLEIYEKCFYAEFNKTETIHNNLDYKVALSATGSIPMLIKLANEINALASQSSVDLMGTSLGGLYYQIMERCEQMRLNVEENLHKLGH